MTRILTRPKICATLNILISSCFIFDYVGKLRIIEAIGWDWTTFAYCTADFVGKLIITLIMLEKIILKRSR